jgi:hypothetical protein
MTQVGTGTDPLNAGGLYIETMCTDASGNVYAAGRFQDIGGKAYVAKWDGTAWSEVGTGNNALDANDYILSICFDHAGHLYAAGKFKNSGGLFAYVAMWNGTNWTEVGAGQNLGLSGGYIQDFTSICADASGNIYAVGDITDNTAGNYEVSKWDGTNWTEVGVLNANSTINSVAVDGNKVYVAGAFTNSTPGSGHPYLAEWDGTSWSEVGAGSGALNAGDVINVVAVDASHNVYVGGEFQDLSFHKYIAKWNGSSWSELGGAASLGQSQDVGGVYALITDASGNVYAAGGMLDANTNEFVGKWNGTSWSNLGNLAGNNFVNALATDNTNFYAGGAFMNSSSSPYVAKYTPATGIGEIVALSSTLSPNPANGAFEISFGKLTSATITLTDLTGKAMETWEANEAAKVQCNIQKYATGIYLVRIATIDGQSQTIKIVKE